MPPVLQIIQQQGTGPDRHRAILTFTEEGWAPHLVTLEFGFSLSDQDREDIRWYLEDYLEFAEDPAPQIAARIERRMAEIGNELYRALFQGSDDARDLWAALRPRLGEARIEVVASVQAATAIPWELLRDPRTGAYAALEARAFVRGPQPNAVSAPSRGRSRKAEKVRILLAICRPKGGEDVPFRSIAGLLAKGLTGGASDAFDLYVLRPPTFDQLAKVLRQAREDGAPFHAVHFDGHGIYADPAELGVSAARIMGGLRLDASGTRPAPGQRGLILFEDPDDPANAAFVDGFKIGALLREAGVPILILNACQSAFAEAPSQPATAVSDGGSRETVEAYGSLAQAVLDAGTAGIVAMRYSVYVVTAAQFVAELYDALTRGRTLGEAVSLARKHLHERPERTIAFDPRPLQDWSVPIVWERQPRRLWPVSKKAKAPAIHILPEGDGLEGGAALGRELPARPDVGFYGRDETLYAIDRGFDANRVVLLHAYAGAGKTATAAEFARWYRATGGVQGPVLFSSFERHLPLARLLDQIGVAFPGLRTRDGREWDAISDPKSRRELAFKALAQTPALWIWDNVEPVTGFPAGAVSEWNAAEQRELVDFLRDATEHGTQAKFLITSRREERNWLGDLPMRVAMPPMPMRERLQLAHALVRRRGLRPPALPDLRPLLRFTNGNPLTILVTTGQALREGIDTQAQLDAYVAKLRAGAVEFADEAEGRNKNLAASLAYGFHAGFIEEERRALSLLHLFHGFVDASDLCLMGHPANRWCIEACAGWTWQQGVTLLDRAADIGMLTSQGVGHYWVHPALRWFFRDLFERFHRGTAADRARCAFARAMRFLGYEMADRFNQGDRAVLGRLVAEEDNLRAAFAFARTNGLWEEVLGAMKGLWALYSGVGRRSEWRRMIEAAMPDFVDPASNGPLPGREKQWHEFLEYQIHLAREDRDWALAERLAQKNLEQYGRRIGVPTKPEVWDDEQRINLFNLSNSLVELGQVQAQQRHEGSIANFEEALNICHKLGDRQGEAICALHLGSAFWRIRGDLQSAEHWLRRSLELRPANDNLGLSKCMLLLTRVVFLRCSEETGREFVDYSEAAYWCQQALDLLPDTAVNELCEAHLLLGMIYRHVPDKVNYALNHFQHAIRYAEACRDTLSAGKSRYAAARLLLEAGRLRDARAYAGAALATFRQLGDHTVDDLPQTEVLLGRIDAAIAEGARQ
jgi:tetratricopeptide (TPR) repeat protein